MLTFVVDFQNMTNDIYFMRPLFYPLIAKNRFKWMEGCIHEEQSAKRIMEDISTHLHKSNQVEARLVLLLGLPLNDQGRKGFDYYNGSLSWALRRVTQIIIDGLRNGKNYNVVEVYAVVLDELDRELTTGRPKTQSDQEVVRNENIRVWELDTRGYSETKDEMKRMLCKTDLDDLQSCWNKLPEWSERAVNAGFDGLDESCKKVLEENISNLKSKAKSLCDVVVNCSKDKTSSNKDRENIAKRYQDIFNEFMASIEQQKKAENMNPLLTFSPFQKMEELIKTQMSLAEFSGKIKMIRFPVKTQPPITRQMDLIKLVYLIFTLTHDDLWQDISPDPSKFIQVLDIKFSDLTPLYGTWDHILQSCKNQLQSEKISSLAGQADLINDTLLQRSNEKTMPGKYLLPKKVQLHWFAEYSRETSEFKNWQEEITQALQNQDKVVRSDIKNIYMDMHRSVVQHRETVKTDDLEEEYAKSKNAYETAKNEASAVKLNFPDLSRWKDIQKKKLREFAVAAAQRPDRNRALLAMSVGLGLLAVGYGAGFTHHPPGVDGYYPYLVPFWVVICSMLIFVILLHQNRLRLQKIIDNIYDEARSDSNTIKQMYEKGKIRALALCKVNVKRFNLDAISNVLKKALNIRRKADFHLSETEKHIGYAKQLIRIFNIQQTGDEYQDSKKKIDVHQPIHKSDAYCPANCASNARNEHEVNFIISQQTKKLSFDCNTIGLLSVQIRYEDLNKFGISK